MPESIQTRIYHPHAGIPELLADDAETMGVVRALRLQPGAHFGCFNGDGMECVYAIQSIEKRQLTAGLVSQTPNPRDPQQDLTILLASTKGKTKDTMVKELTALGATKIVLYHAERSVSLPDEKQTERLRKIAVESCRQCERSTIPRVEIIPRELHQLPTNTFTSPLICFYEKAQPEAMPRWDSSASKATLVFGPEGGFTEKEIAFLNRKDAQFCSLGRRILRAELAVSVGTVLVQYQRGGM